MSEPDPQAGLNGVAITRIAAGAAYRTFEVHQRERVGESTALVKPADFITTAFAENPYPLLNTLREHYPCYRNWLTNTYWLTRYDDVTSIFADDANFASRSKCWCYGIDGLGADLGGTIEVRRSHADYVDAHTRVLADRLAEQLAIATARAGQADLVAEFTARLPLELLVGWLDLPEAGISWFVTRYWAIQRGRHWAPLARQAGRKALDELIGFFTPIIAARRTAGGTDLVSVVAQLETPRGPARAEDLVVTLLEWDNETLHGGLTNLWYLLLTHPAALALVRAERRFVKPAYLETMRHSTPILSAQRFARHEVERFGRLLPQGALVICSAAAANRDPRTFDEPDLFVPNRKDLCQREPRGQYRADGLASGITFGIGKPSIHPALPEDRARSLYAVTRDTVITASSALMNAVPRLELADDSVTLRCLYLDGLHTCWSLPVRAGR